jgi:squalene-hopene/tetraprenyl-beta-curcumene cyclase
VDTVRDDGSWPIDTNLATWNTTLAVNALAQAGDQHTVTEECWRWIESCQHTKRHPFTGADPGGWGWSNLSGAVPDADDTPSALLALRQIAEQPAAPNETNIQMALTGITWLLDLQNRNGGWPTFCRGWGRLPFDRSGSDLTAHAIRALHAWRDNMPHKLRQASDRATKRGFDFLAGQQRMDGSWHPLWFGNQHHPAEENPVYGTAKVLLAYRDTRRLDDGCAKNGFAWLAGSQMADGGWNAGMAGLSSVELCQGVETKQNITLSIVEETALAVEALLSNNSRPSQNAARRGIDWLIEAVRQQRHLEPTPIGYYFAKLWYYEKLYPLLFTVSALGAAVRSRHAADLAR